MTVVEWYKYKSHAHTSFLSEVILCVNSIWMKYTLCMGEWCYGVLMYVCVSSFFLFLFSASFSCALWCSIQVIVCLPTPHPSEICIAPPEMGHNNCSWATNSSPPLPKKIGTPPPPHPPVAPQHFYHSHGLVTKVQKGQEISHTSLSPPHAKLKIMM